MGSIDWCIVRVLNVSTLSGGFDGGFCLMILVTSPWSFGWSLHMRGSNQGRKLSQGALVYNWIAPTALILVFLMPPSDLDMLAGVDRRVLLVNSSLWSSPAPELIPPSIDGLLACFGFAGEHGENCGRRGHDRSPGVLPTSPPACVLLQVRAAEHEEVSEEASVLEEGYGALRNWIAW